MVNDLKKALLISLSIVLIGWSFVDDRLPMYDENFYLEHAYSLYKYNVFGQSGNQYQKQDAPEPSARVAPLMPLFLSVAMHLNKEFAGSVECHLWEIEEKKVFCSNKFKFPRIMQLIFFAFCMGYVWILIKDITRSEITSCLTVIFLLLSSAPFYYANHFLTEPIYFPCALIFILYLVKGVAEYKCKYFVLSSVFLGLTALARPSFYYLFFMLLFVMPIFFLFSNHKWQLKKVVKNCIIFSLIFFLTVGGWLARNHQLYNKATITVGYGILPLTTRLSLNRMTSEEYIIGWIYYIPRVGNLVLRNIFLGEDGYKKLDYLKYWFSEREKLRDEIKLLRNASVNNYKSGQDIIPTSWVIKRYMFGDIYNHIKLTFLLAWYGIFVQSLFGVFALPLLIWGLSKSSNIELGPKFKIMCVPPLLMLIFNAWFTASIPRYNLIFLLPMSLVYAVALQVLIKYIYTKRYNFNHLIKK